jgi:Ca2+/H+ antiporter, TMEM165/GDT1 family
VESLLTTFIAAALAEFGDKTQLLVIALAARYGRPGPVLAGAAAAALANSMIAAAGGILIHDMVTLRALSLLVAVALLYAGIAGLMRRKAQALAASRMPAFLVSALAFFTAEFGDRTQFITGALAAQYDSLLLSALGATAGIAAANIPAALLGARAETLVPLRAIRLAAAACFLLAGLVIAVHALRLI